MAFVAPAYSDTITEYLNETLCYSTLQQYILAVKSYISKTLNTKKTTHTYTHTHCYSNIYIN